MLEPGQDGLDGLDGQDGQDGLATLERALSGLVGPGLDGVGAILGLGQDGLDGLDGLDRLDWLDAIPEPVLLELLGLLELPPSLLAVLAISIAREEVYEPASRDVERTWNMQTAGLLFQGTVVLRAPPA